MKTIIRNILANPGLKLQLIVGGGAVLEEYGNLLEVIKNSNLNVDHVVHYVVDGENPVVVAKSAALALSEFSTAFQNLEPDIVMVIADRYECLPIAMAAILMNIPIAHLEGGEVSGSVDESIRHAITKLAHIHFPATEEAAVRIEKMGEDSRFIFPVGCPSLDVLATLDISFNSIKRSHHQIGSETIVDFEKPYLIVLQHPVSTEYESNVLHIQETIKVVEALEIGTAWICPNIDAGTDGISKGLRQYKKTKRPKHVQFLKSLPIEHYGPLLNNAACIVGNSSSGIREASFLGIPAVNIGSRQNGRQRSNNVIDVEYKAGEIKAAVLKQMEIGRYKSDFIYGDGNSGKKIAKVLSEVDVNCQKKIRY